MYKVVLIHKENGEIIGDIGTYDDLDDANEQANDYNRKGDRHIGHAVVQAEIGNKPVHQPRRGLNIQRNPQRLRMPNMVRPTPPHFKPQQRFSRTVVENEYEEQSSEEELSSEYEEQSSEEIVQQPQRQLRTPSWHQRQEQPQATIKQFAFLIDTRSGKAIVLEKNKFLNNFLLAHPTYTIQNTGEIHDMILERNQYLQSRKR